MDRSEEVPQLDSDRPDHQKPVLDHPRPGGRHGPLQDHQLRGRPVHGAEPIRRLLAWQAGPRQIVRREFKDPTTALLAFDKGEINMTYVTADEVTREQGNSNATIIAGPSQVDNAVVFNPLANPAFGNK